MSTINTVLSLDTSLGTTQVALAQKGRILGQLEEKTRSQQTQRLIPMIEQILKENGLTYPDVDLWACSTGPGSFSGIRVGISTVRAITLATQAAVYGATTLELFAWQAKEAETVSSPGIILSVVDAYRDELFVQPFHATAQGMEPSGEAALIAQEALAMLIPSKTALIATNATGLVEALIPSFKQKILSIEAVNAAAFCRYAIYRNEPSNRRNLAPFYLREPDAKLPQRKAL
jgi:tRNA threonylcarbamoyladenosine biosynthesis protein TsaB